MGIADILFKKISFPYSIFQINRIKMRINIPTMENINPNSANVCLLDFFMPIHPKIMPKISGIIKHPIVRIEIMPKMKAAMPNVLCQILIVFD